jgi:hypothetical protein
MGHGNLFRSLSVVLGLTTNLLWWYKPYFMEDCAPSTFIRSWTLVALYLCSRFCIFDKHVLEEYVFKVEGGPHHLQSCSRVV